MEPVLVQEPLVLKAPVRLRWIPRLWAEPLKLVAPKAKSALRNSSQRLSSWPRKVRSRLRKLSR